MSNQTIVNRHSTGNFQFGEFDSLEILPCIISFGLIVNMDIEKDYALAIKMFSTNTMSAYDRGVKTVYDTPPSTIYDINSVL